MKDERRLKYCERLYRRFQPKLQELTDASMVEVFTEKAVSPKQVFCALLFFAVAFIIMGYPKKRFEDINILCVKETACDSSRVYFKKK